MFVQKMTRITSKGCINPSVKFYRIYVKIHVKMNRAQNSVLLWSAELESLE